MSLSQLPDEVLEWIFGFVPPTKLKEIWFQMDKLNSLRPLIEALIDLQVPCWNKPTGEDPDDKLREFCLLAEFLRTAKFKSMKLNIDSLSATDLERFEKICRENPRILESVTKASLSAESDSFSSLASKVSLEGLKTLKLTLEGNIDTRDIPKTVEILELSFFELDDDVVYSFKGLPESIKFMELLGPFDSSEIELPTGLRRLQCAGGSNFWTKLPPGLERLSIGNCHADLKLVDFPESLTCLAISVSRQTDLDIKDVKWPPNLEELTIIGGRLTPLSQVRFPDRLKTIVFQAGLYCLYGAVFPDSVEELQFRLCLLDLIDGVTLPKYLKTLDLSYNPISLIEYVQFPTSLEHLNLNQNSVSSIKSAVLPNLLKYLNMRDNEIESLDDLNLPDSLETLVLTSNHIKFLDGVKFPTSLKNLSLDDNELEELSNVELPNFVSLNLDSGKDTCDRYPNSLTSVSKVTFPSTLEVLSVIDQPVGDWSLTALPGKLKELKLLFSESPELLRLPESLRLLSLAVPQDSPYDKQHYKVPSNLEEFNFIKPVKRIADYSGANFNWDGSNDDEPFDPNHWMWDYSDFEREDFIHGRGPFEEPDTESDDGF